MNLFTKFFASFFAIFAGLFSAKGYQRKVNQHNQEAYQAMRNKLQPLAKRFLLPVCKRDKNGVLIKDKTNKKYDQFIKDQREKKLIKDGCSWYDVGTQRYLCRNEKNALRKHLNYANNLLLT